MHRGAAVVCRVLAGILAGCGSGCQPRLDALAPDGAIVPFRKIVVDARPLSGPDCCTDVLAVGDLNRDGLPDIVVGAEKSVDAGLVWYEAPAWQRRAIARGEFTTDGQVADVDGDGWQDVVVGETVHGLSWFRNPAAEDGTWTRHTVSPGYVHDVEVSDFDGDSRPDIVTSDKKKVSVWFASADGQWHERPVIVAPGEGLATGDIDADGRPDVAFGASWLRNPGNRSGDWTRHVVAPRWPADTRVRVADMNGDGRPDLVVSASEGEGHVSWFEAPVRPTEPSWREHTIVAASLTGVHSLQVADFDGDSTLDVLAAEMHTGGKRVLVGTRPDGAWRLQILSEAGTHNARVADMDGDGDMDVVGKNYAGSDRAIEAWENLSRDLFGDYSPTRAPFTGDGWSYVGLDSGRPDDQRGKMGLAFADVNADGRDDIIAGSYVYRNPGSVRRTWPRQLIAPGVDVYFARDVNGNSRADLIGARGLDLVWCEAPARRGDRWTVTVVGRLPLGRTQGYIVAPIEDSGRDALVFTRGRGLYYIVPPLNGTGTWPLVRVSEAAEEEGVAAADLDGDGDPDLVATASDDGYLLVWFENPGARTADWRRHVIGRSDQWIDRVAAVDLNEDGRVDVVASNETRDLSYNADLFWFEHQPDDGWRRHRVATFRSLNSLDVADMNGDGQPDLVAAEHTDFDTAHAAANNLTVVFVNRGDSWKAQPVDVAPRSSHLGARTHDLDGDGRQEIVSTGWGQFRSLHLWTRTGGGAGLAKR